MDNATDALNHQGDHDRPIDYELTDKAYQALGLQQPSPVQEDHDDDGGRR